MSPKKKTFYIATSYERKDIANELAKIVMTEKKELWPIFPWWSFDEEDRYHKHQGAVGILEIQAAAEADFFVWVYPVRKGGWCELGAACYMHSRDPWRNNVIMIIPESAEDDYLPPFAYQPDVCRVIIPDKTYKNTKKLAAEITRVMSQIEVDECIL